MKTFDLSHLKKTQFYKDVVDCKGVLLSQLEIIDACSESIDMLMDKKDAYSKHEIIQSLKSKITYTEKLVELLIIKVSDGRFNARKKFLYDPENYPKDKTFYHCYSLFLDALPKITDYLFEVKSFLAEAEMLLTENISVEEMLGPQGEHVWAIAQSLLPSTQSLATLFLAQLRTEIESHAELNSPQLQEVINELMKRGVKNFANALYQEEDGLAVNTLNGMRAHYVKKLAEFEKLFQENANNLLSIKQLQQENEKLLMTLNSHSSLYDDRIQGLERQVCYQKEEITKKEECIEMLGKSLGNQHEKIAQSEETIRNMGIRIEVQKHLIDNQIKELALLNSKASKKNNDDLSFALIHSKKDRKHLTSLLVRPGFFKDSETTEVLKKDFRESSKARGDEEAVPSCLTFRRKKD
ncbi:MAG: hypothetical protein H2069_09640 [Legionella sp.]|nr:hypothetical protein [Legionella sp.]